MNNTKNYSKIINNSKNKLKLQIIKLKILIHPKLEMAIFHSFA